jgi:hypothetical protein
LYGKTLSCKRDVTRFVGDRPIFGCYLDHNGELTGASLWGHPDDEWPGRYIEREEQNGHVGDYFVYQFWHVDERRTRTGDGGAE